MKLNRTLKNGGGQSHTMLFKMNGCGHCESLKPDWNKVVKKISQIYGGKVGAVNGYNTIQGSKTHDISVIDAGDDGKKAELGKKYNGGQPFSIGGYPTIKRAGKNGTVEYNGERTEKAIENFITHGKTVGGKRKTKKHKNQRGTRKNNNRRKSLGNWLNKLF